MKSCNCSEITKSFSFLKLTVRGKQKHTGKHVFCEEGTSFVRLTRVLKHNHVFLMLNSYFVTVTRRTCFIFITNLQQN